MGRLWPILLAGLLAGCPDRASAPGPDLAADLNRADLSRTDLHPDVAEAGPFDLHPDWAGDLQPGPGACTRDAASHVQAGTWDDSAINAAINDVLAHCPGGAGIVDVGPAQSSDGVWWITDPVTPGSSIWLRGAGPTTVLRMSPGRPTGFAMIRALNQAGVVISDLKLDGNRTAQGNAVRQQGVQLDGTIRSTVFNVEVSELAGAPASGSEAAGINVRHAFGYDAHVTIHDCVAHHIGGYGIGTWNASFVTVKSCVGHDNDSHGISLSAADSGVGHDNLVEDCDTHGNGRRGVNLENQLRARVVRNKAADNGLSSYRTQNGTDVDFHTSTSMGAPVDFALQHPPASSKSGAPHRISWTGYGCTHPCGFVITTSSAPGSFADGCPTVFGYQADFCFLHD